MRPIEASPRRPASPDDEVPGRGRSLRRPAAAAGAVAAGFLILVGLLYVTALHASVPDSDGATVVLQGQVMSAGNLTLHNWSLALDPFWTVDALFYTVIERFTGLQAALLYLGPAIIASLVIIVGAALAGDGQRGAARVAAAATVVALLALPSQALGSVFLRGPLHVGTVLWCLIAFAGLRWGRFGWGWALAVVFFAAGTLGDAETVVFGIVPVVAAGLAAAVRTRRWRSGAPEVSAAGAAIALAWLIRQAAVYVGTYTITRNRRATSPAQMVADLKYLAAWGANLLGVGGGSGVAAPVQVVHLIGVLAVLGGVAAAAIALARGLVKGTPAQAGATAPWRLDDLLVLAFFGSLAVFLALTISADSSFLRELTAAVIFGSILAGRWVGRLTAAISSPRLRREGAIAGIAVIAVFASGSGVNVAKPRPVRPYEQLGKFLEAHHLRRGIGDFWSSSIVTVATGGAVTVRPVTTRVSGRIVAFPLQASRSWYTEQTFRFLVYDTTRPWQGVDYATAIRTFGPVAHTYAVGSYWVLVWSHPIKVSLDKSLGTSQREAWSPAPPVRR